MATLRIEIDLDSDALSTDREAELASILRHISKPAARIVAPGWALVLRDSDGHRVAIAYVD